MSDSNTLLVFKHSVIKRRGEEDVTIWVDHGFEEAIGPQEEDPSVDRRALTIVDNDFRPHTGGWHYNTCNNVGMTGNSGPNAPCTGGLREIVDWVY